MIKKLDEIKKPKPSDVTKKLGTTELDNTTKPNKIVQYHNNSHNSNTRPHNITQYHTTQHHTSPTTSSYNHSEHQAVPPQ